LGVGSVGDLQLIGASSRLDGVLLSRPVSSSPDFFSPVSAVGPVASSKNPALEAIFQREYRTLRPRAEIPRWAIEFYGFANVNNTIRLRGDTVKVRISDLLAGAPAPVLAAIAHILLAKLYRKPIEPQQAARYRRYIGAREFSAKVHLVRQLRGRKRLHGAEGRCWDLNAIFDDLNARFFHSLMARPEMTWSAERARHLLGHFDPAHNTIVVSRIFDHPAVPKYAVEYLVYHEMLHLKHPVRLRGSRRCVHSAAFQADERLFPQLDEAKRFLKTL